MIREMGQWILGACILVNCSRPANCQPVAADDARSQARVSELIAQLSSASFAIREQASQELLAIGQPAVGQLAGISADAMYEQRLRASTLRSNIESRVFDELSRKFLFDADGTKSYGLPGWQAFRRMVGSSRTSKQLFLDMVREQRGLIELVEAADSQTASPAETADANSRLAAAAAAHAATMEERLYRFAGTAHW